MQITINRISFKDFCSFKYFELELNSKNALISGSNGAGKTSIANGLLWLFFGKDINGKQFNPKPVNEEKEEISGTEPTVEAELVIDGKTIVLKRVLLETWTKKRNELEKTRGNDTTNYYMEGVPKKEKEFNAYVEELADPNLLMILLNTQAFMRLDWKVRREMLVDLTNLTDEQIIASNSDFKDIDSILNGHTIDDTKKILKAEKKQIKQEIESLPARINENLSIKNSLETELSESEVEAQLADIQEKIQVITEKKSRIKNGGAAVAINERLSEIKVELADERASFLQGEQLRLQVHNDDVSLLQEKYNSAQLDYSAINNELATLERSINNRKELREDLLIKWRNAKSDTLESLEELEKTYQAEKEKIMSYHFDDSDTRCKTCGQALPADEVEKLKADYNQRKSNKLEEMASKFESDKGKISSDGVAKVNSINELIAKEKATKADIEKLEENYIELAKNVEALEVVATESKELFEKQKAELDQERTKFKFEDSETYKKLNMEAENLQAQLLDIDKANDTQLSNVNSELEKVESEKEELLTLKSNFNQIKSIESRIEELTAEDKKLKEENQECERKMFLLEEFIRTKVKMLEESINSQFEMVKFKLFETQKNGGLNEICEATYNGVGYSSSLNNGAKVNCDIDIVNVLSKKHEINVPMFIDNAESVNELITTESQRIELRVAKNKKLKVEVEE